MFLSNQQYTRAALLAVQLEHLHSMTKRCVVEVDVELEEQGVTWPVARSVHQLFVCLVALVLVDRKDVLLLTRLLSVSTTQIIRRVHYHG